MIFAFYITEPNGLQRLVFVRGTDYGNAFGKARRHAAFSGSTVRAGHLGDTPATDTDAKQAAGSLMLDEVSPGGNVISFGTTSGGGSLQQTNFFEGGGGAKVMPSPLGDGDGKKAPAPEERSGDDPLLPEGAGGRYAAQAAWARALDAIGMGGGIPGAIASSRFTPLQNIASIGAAGGLFNNPSYPLFQGLGEGRELQDFFQTALPGVGGRNLSPGVHPMDMAAKAKQLFNFENPTAELSMIYNPALGVAAGTPGQTLENVSGDAAAKMIAQLGLTGYGRGRFGALGGFLPSAERLVADYAAQPQGSAQTDIREYIKNRLSAVSQ